MWGVLTTENQACTFAGISQNAFNADHTELDMEWGVPDTVNMFAVLFNYDFTF